MRQRRPRFNWFLIVVVLILIAVVTYIDRFILPTTELPFTATETATRDPESYVADAEKLFDQGKLNQSIDTYMEAIRIRPNDPSIHIALVRVQQGNTAVYSLELADPLSVNVCHADCGGGPKRTSTTRAVTSKTIDHSVPALCCAL